MDVYGIDTLATSSLTGRASNAMPLGSPVKRPLERCKLDDIICKGASGEFMCPLTKEAYFASNAIRRLYHPFSLTLANGGGVTQPFRVF